MIITMEADDSTPQRRPRKSNGDLNVAELEAELDEFLEIMSDFDNLAMDSILESLSAFTVRATSIRMKIVRTNDRNLNAFRTKQLDPFLRECDRQFRVWSRRQSVKQLEWETSRGQR